MQDGRPGRETAEDAQSAPDRKLLWLGALSMLIALLSYVFAWHGGPWAMPIWSALAIATWGRAWRRGISRWVSAGLVMAGLAILVGAYAFLSSGGLQPAEGDWYA
jgi:hypothetical protein